MKISIGMDIGSTFTKVCVMAESMNIVSLSSFASPVNQKDFFQNYCNELKNKYGTGAITSCGYGRQNSGADFTLSELAALSKGVGLFYPGPRTVLDIGGQDSKTVQCENGKLVKFFLNDKCAAGSGLFLQNAMRILNMNFEQLAIEAGEIKPLSTVCAVFAQTEIVRGIASGKSAKQLSDSVLCSILRQASATLRQVKQHEHVIFTGGISLIRGIDGLLSSLTGSEVIVPQHSAYLSAIGCALLGAEKLNNDA